jgi:hypothetical protein
MILSPNHLWLAAPANEGHSPLSEPLDRANLQVEEPRKEGTLKGDDETAIERVG